MTLLRQLLVLALALFVIACGGGGSGSGGDGAGSGDGAGGGDGVEMRSVLVRWRASADVAGYVIHWGRTSGVYTHALDVGSPAVDGDGVINFSLDQTGAGGTIYFALTSYDENGRMSGFSNELSAAVP